MARLVIISNRISSPREKQARAGGLAVALREALKQRGGLWLGWSGEVVPNPAGTAHVISAGNVDYATIDFSPDEHRKFYVDFANSTLWPIFHYRMGLIDFSPEALDGYMMVNRRFAESLLPLLQPGDLIWVHDYHFLPLAAELRRLGIRNRIGYFHHIPFPAPEVAIALPRHEMLIGALAQYDLVGFQTPTDAKAFVDYLALEAPDHSSGPDGRQHAFNRDFRVQAFPIGIDTEGFAKLGELASKNAETHRLVESLVGRKLVIGVDRLDYSKGIPQRLRAFGMLLAKHPEHHRRVTYMQIAPVSRGEVSQYRKLRNELERLTGHINGRFTEYDWAPVRYLNKSVPRNTLAGFYRHAAIGLVTPLRDGMNLVAKEYVAAQNPMDPGVLVLSRFAGAARELQGALAVNPHDPEQIADAIDQALTMPREERIERWQGMMAVLRSNTIEHWRESYLTALRDAKINLDLVS